MHYIYLNEYPNGTLYVGSHTWSGSGIDPSYHGSSKVAESRHWFPISIKIIEDVTNRADRLAREHYWIEHYAKLVGISDCVPSNSWTSQFPQHGRLINGHSNSMAQALSVHTKESLQRQARLNFNDTTRKKASATRQNNSIKYFLPDGFSGTPSQIAQHLNMNKGTVSSACHFAKKYGSYNLSGTYILSSPDVNIEECELKRKADELARGRSRRSRKESRQRVKYLVEFNNSQYRGTALALRSNGFPVSWATAINEKFQSSPVVIHHGHKFTMLGVCSNLKYHLT